MDASLLGLILGAIVGLILAFTGAGGGILAVPMLVFGLHLTMMEAAPVGLIAVGASAAFGALLGLRAGQVRYRAAALIGAVGMAIAPLGVMLAHVLPNAPLLVVFAFVLALVAWRMFRQTLPRRAGTAAPAAGAERPCRMNPADGRLHWTAPCARALAGTGAVAGILSGLLGVGGGFVIVPALTHYTEIEVRSILATSLAVIALVSVGGVTAAAVRGTVHWPVAGPFAVGAIVALVLGRQVAARLAGPHLQRAFAVVSGATAVLLLARGMGWLGL
ncbi:MAG: sulfite exporter TauE/SafE family protein [Burkholderiales bacterium]|nr:sulfite exporter TauE/SafE family protein [Burkholderiales bacterium]MDE2275265.1 sulfite exporter TauE/SafE family protein [Burkholderiales bacterium]